VNPAIDRHFRGSRHRACHDEREHVAREVGARSLGDRFGQRLAHRRVAFEVLATQLGRAGNEANSRKRIFVRRVGQRPGVLAHHRVGKRFPERLAGRTGAQRFAGAARAVHSESADGFVFARKVIVEGPRGHAGRGGDVLDEHVLQAVLDGKSHGRPAEGLSSGDLFAFAQRSRPFDVVARQRVHCEAVYQILRATQICATRNIPRATVRESQRSNPVTICGGPCLACLGLS
jgi:hypothetical protein